MKEPVIYLKADQSVCYNKRTILIKDIANVYTASPEITHEVEKMKLFTFPDVKNGREIISMMKIVEEIKKRYKEAEIVNLGEPDVIVYYKRPEPIKKWIVSAKIGFVCLTAFFGAGISIMGYNNDIDVEKVFSQLYWMATGTKSDGPTILSFCYSIGLTIGIIVFFNHASKKRLSDEPTPFEVQMRLYEKDVNNTLITGAGRKEEEIDVDT
ncbi:MAG: stage V sporulation protein AA [Lachnospiraceae bacterium]|nr:stage V sporulation protein AA [Lachnospiraceae bacterium]